MGFPAIPALEQNYQYQNYGQGSKIGRLGGLQVGGYQPVAGAEQGITTNVNLENKTGISNQSIVLPGGRDTVAARFLDFSAWHSLKIASIPLV